MARATGWDIYDPISTSSSAAPAADPNVGVKGAGAWRSNGPTVEWVPNGTPIAAPPTTPTAPVSTGLPAVGGNPSALPPSAAAPMAPAPTAPAALPSAPVPTTPQAPTAFAPPASAPTRAAGWDQYDPAGASTAAASAQPAPPEGSAADNAASAAVDATGYALGAPNMIGRLADNLYAATINGASHLAPSWTGIPTTHLTGDDFTKYDPLSLLPSADDINKNFSYPLQHKIADATGLPRVDPYTPQTTAGEIGHAALGGGLAAAADPFSAAGDGASAILALANTFKGMAKTGLASGVAGAVNSVLPNNPMLAALAAFLTHAGVSSAERAATGVATPTIGSLLSPRSRGEMTAGQDLLRANNGNTNMATLASPSADTISANANAVRNATDVAGGYGNSAANFAADVRSRGDNAIDGLEQARRARADTNFDAARAQPAIIPDNAKTITGRTDAPRALGEAWTDMQRQGKDGFAPWTDLNDQGEPVYRNDALTPDMLMRGERKIATMARDGMKTDPAGSGPALTHEAAGMQKDLRGLIPGYGKALDEYSADSEHLRPFEHPDVASLFKKTADGFTGKETGNALPDEKVFSKIVGASAPNAVITKLVGAVGSVKGVIPDLKNSIVAYLREEGAIKPDGEIDASAFDRISGKYQNAIRALDMHGANLTAEFGNMRALQDTLDLSRAQRTLSDTVEGGALRSTSGATAGVVTRSSFGQWLGKNAGGLAKTQSPAAISSLRRLQAVLPEDVTASARGGVDVIAGVVGRVLGGSAENAVLSLVGHGFWDATLGRRVNSFGDYYSSALEKAVRDPSYAKTLMMHAGSQKSLLSKLVGDYMAAARQAPIAANAGQSATRPAQP